MRKSSDFISDTVRTTDFVEAVVVDVGAAAEKVPGMPPIIIPSDFHPGQVQALPAHDDDGYSRFCTTALVQ